MGEGEIEGVSVGEERFSGLEGAAVRLVDASEDPTPPSHL